MRNRTAGCLTDARFQSEVSVSNQETFPSSNEVRQVEELDNLVNLVRTTARSCLERPGNHPGIFEELEFF